MTNPSHDTRKPCSSAGPSTGPLTVRRVPRTRAPIPHYYYPDRWGPRTLMDCRTCRAPFARTVDIPHDRLCSACRAERDDATPSLLEVID